MHKRASSLVYLFHVLERVLSLWIEVWASVTKHFPQWCSVLNLQLVTPLDTWLQVCVLFSP